MFGRGTSRNTLACHHPHRGMKMDTAAGVVETWAKRQTRPVSNLSLQPGPGDRPTPVGRHAETPWTHSPRSCSPAPMWSHDLTLHNAPRYDESQPAVAAARDLNPGVVSAEPPSNLCPDPRSFVSAVFAGQSGSRRRVRLECVRSRG